jgi:hypothetical protein
VTVLASTANSVAYYGLAVFLVAVGLGSFFMLFKLGQVFGRLSSFVSGTERDLLPVIVKTGGTVDRVNKQLDKADTITDSAVSMADSADTAVRAVSMAITKPVEKVSGFAAGVAHGVSSFRKNRDFQGAMKDAKDAAARRAADLHEDLTAAGTTNDPGSGSGKPAA